ncbi:Rv0909 family putative TA system antitoxin [Kribbella sp. NPDC051620]|uniref:antitoxin n=1 Tax=Kribbella sp. NPDC051620 TaxID=3364120 RepID=UPI00378C440E
MNDFQDQAKNWLRNVVKQNPDKIKAGVEKAGDLIDKQTGGKYADKVDSVQEKVGGYVDSHADPAKPAGGPGTTSTEQSSADTTADASAADEGTAGSADAGPDQSSGPGTADTEGAGDEPVPGTVDEAAPDPEASGEPVPGSVDEAAPDPEGDEAEIADEAAPEAVDGTVVGGEVPDVSSNPSSSAGSGTEGVQTGGTATGTSEGGLPGPR